MRNPRLAAILVALASLARSASAADSATPAAGIPATEADQAASLHELDTPLALRPAQQVQPGGNAPLSAGQPVFLRADQVEGYANGEIHARGAVELRQRGLVVSADDLMYSVPDERCIARGAVVVDRTGDRVTGPHAEFNLRDQSGSFEQPQLLLGATPERPNPARASADRATFIDAQHDHLEQAAYTTCRPGQDDWFLTGSTVDLDRLANMGEARNARIVFEGVPLLYSPYMSFPLDDQRRSGFLAPTLGTTATNGVDISLPYYFNLAPNYDDTLTTRMMSRRGLLLGNEFRYLGENFHGAVTGEVLNHDILAGQRRYFLGVLHDESLPWGLSLHANAQEVSDNNYFRDLSTAIGATSTTYLPRDFGLDWSAGDWQLGARALSYQTIRDPVLPTVDLYRERPQLVANWLHEAYGAEWSLQNEFTDFRHPTEVQGQRHVTYASVRLPFEADWGYVTPKVGYHYTGYALDREVIAGGGQNPTRSLPVTSVDAGLYFERTQAPFGDHLDQTLEPRLYYLNIPYRNQDALPVFNTGVAEFSYSQLFAENGFNGPDRINDASQLTAAVQSRLIDTQTGEERVRALIGQRFYYRAQGVALPGQVVRTDNTSDLLAGLAGRLGNTIGADLLWDWNPSLARTEKLGVGGHWYPEPGRAINLSYRINRDTPGQPDIHQIDVSAQWPIAGHWAGVVRVNYDTAQATLVEGLAGAEYTAGCWTFRVVMHRLAVSAVQTNSALFVQLELNGLVRLGTNPLDTLRLNIPGYTKTNETLR